METQKIIHCIECTHCFKSRRSKTGYACGIWGYDDFADDTVLNGFCHKAKLAYDAELRKQQWEVK